MFLTIYEGMNAYYSLELKAYKTNCQLCSLMAYKHISMFFILTNGKMFLYLKYTMYIKIETYFAFTRYFVFLNLILICEIVTYM